MDSRKESLGGELRKAIEAAQEILGRRGRRALEEAMKRIPSEGIECKEVLGALEHFRSRWLDLARPTLLSLACEAVGGDPEATISVAIAMTHIAGAIDIYDDIIDESTMKRSRPTMLGRFGRDVTLLTATALLFIGFIELYRLLKKGLPAEKLECILDVVERSFFELGDAEALELNLRQRTDVAPEEYLHVIRKKAADVEALAHIGAILGGGSEEEIKALCKYGRSLGMLMILRDDLGDMLDFGEFPHRVKKEVLPLPLLYSLRDPGSREELIRILRKRRIGKRDVRRVLEIAYQTGALKSLGELMRKIAGKAIESLHPLRCRRELETLVLATIPPI